MQVIKTPTVDFCSLMNGKSVTSVFFDMVFNILRESGHGDVIHPCPYNVSKYN